MARYKQNDRLGTRNTIREQFIAAAIAEIAGEGYADANINRISQAAGYAKGTIYNHFSSKQSLMLEIIDQLGKDHLWFISEQVIKETHPKERLERFFTAGFQYVELNPAKAQFLVQTLYSPRAEFREPLGEAYQPMFRLLSQEILEPGIVEGVFRNVDPAQNAALLMTLYLGSCSHVDQNSKPMFDPYVVAAFAYQALRNTS